MKTRLAQLSWPLIIALGVFALIRPLFSITGLMDELGKPVTPILMTVGISVVWLAAVLLGRAREPVLTLVCVGLVYGSAAIVLSAILSPMLHGQLEGPLATPGGIGVVMTLLVNAAWGGAVGLLAAGIGATRHRAG
ncbi:hypothetical protein FB384_002043 [Prauserella sediminis]|uniref:Uncharacterized protein n=1 Tax=Prauserella sediminis TaxID=577680 RepID=A0A839XMQ6_9PSEU|nr:hypothetical protein [Prauserella sediminis]MBB3663139.1 hypothetical protein [Prauserella sediminis]